MIATTIDPVLERFWNHTELTDDCWIWRSARHHDGYGVMSVHGRQMLAHRYSYAEFVAPLIDGMHIDHLCRNRACVNPAHLEQVTPAENNARSGSNSAVNARKTHCPQGHPYDTTNTYGRRGCRRCNAATRRRHHDRRKSV